MSVPSTPTHFRLLLQSCTTSSHLHQAHAHLLKLHPSPSSLLLFHSPPSLSSPSLSFSLFSLITSPSTPHFNSLIRSLSSSHSPISVYRSMLRSGLSPNHFTFPFLFKSCSNTLHGLSFHAHVLRTGLHSDPYIQSSLIHFYAITLKDIGSARQVFDLCSAHETVCWNSMIDGFVKNGKIALARDVFERMECKDVVSWNTMINGYALLGELGEAREVFERMPVRNLVSWNSMLAGYVKCGDVEGARRTFGKMPRRDVLSWNTMIAGFAQSRCSEEALEMFDEMERGEVKATDATVVSLLSACAHLGALGRGERLHRLVVEEKIEMNTILATALVDMYAKCGRILRAWEIFNGIESKDALAWNAIIAGVAVHGQAKEALRLLSDMVDNGCRPDETTLVAVLSACSHAGMVREGRQLLDCMEEKYGVEPKVEHYGCVVDLLARRGMLEEAVALVESMPMEPNAPAWGALLGGCRIHGNAEVANEAGKRLLGLQPKHSGRYVLLSNIYASTKRWEDASMVRSMMVTKGIKKEPGMSIVELEGVLNQFMAGDQSHRKSEAIYRKLLEVSERLKVEFGYSPDTRQVLLDIEEEEKEHSLSVHSEKLAVSFGLLHTNPGDTIRIIKNLRVCRDCHHLMKLISKVFCREIIMRDRNRFHLFKNGACSCADYW